MKPPLGDLDASEFLGAYWQQKPLLIRQAFPGIEPELDSGDIAGLACEEMAESRLINGTFPAHDWTIQYGPFSEKQLRSLPAENWTLLVQDVEKHYPPLRELIDRFSFLPRWRVDDLMVSVAAPGGSVGPHVDQYDVFLLQTEGSRRWQIAETFDGALLNDCELNVMKSFEAEQEWTLEPGDMLYLPPGVAHHGVAVDSCMTWSIGMRAPSQADLFQALGEWLADSRGEGLRYADAGMAPATDPGEVDTHALERFNKLANPLSNGAASFNEFLGTFMSRYRLAHQPAPPEQVFDVVDLATALASGARLQHNPWTRLLWLAEGSAALIFAAGMRYSCNRELARTVCDPAKLERLNERNTADDAALLCRLLNDGHLYLEIDA